MQETDTPDEQAFESLLNLSTHQIVRREDPDAFLEWIRSTAPLLLPELTEQVTDPGARDSILTMLGRTIWNSTPLPSNGFRPRPLPKPGRNDACICGSGRKFKHCCGHAPQLDLPLEPELMLAIVLNHLPASQLDSLPFDQLSPEAIAIVARQWLDTDDAKRAVKLLEAYFANTPKPDARSEECLDTLFDAYNILHRPRKKQALIDQMLQSPVSELRVTALQRQCLAKIDARDFKAAWELFGTAQREWPDNPLLANLEIMILIEEGRTQEAEQRAQFWLARLSRRRDEINPGLLDFLERIARDANAAMLEMQDRIIPGLKKLESIIKQANPPTTSLYTIRRFGSMAEWAPKGGKVEALLSRWERVFPLLMPFDDSGELFDSIWNEAASEHWLAFLERTPDALNVLEIISSLLEALEMFPESEMAWANTTLRQPLLEQAYAIIDNTLSITKEDTPLPWVVHENRLPLTVFVELINSYIRQQRWRDALPLLERMVFTLNPDDNHGLRDPLSSAYLYCLQPDKVLHMGFEDDVLPGPLYNRSLALYMLGRVEEAEEALQHARQCLPQVYKFLCARTVKQPSLSPNYITHGGKDQAWYYRQTNLPLWQRSDALQWLCAKHSAGTRTRTKHKQ